MLNHKNWLPEAAEKVELDLEAELRCPLSSATSSRRSSLGDREGDFDCGLDARHSFSR